MTPKKTKTLMTKETPSNTEPPLFEKKEVWECVAFETLNTWMECVEASTKEKALFLLVNVLMSKYDSEKRENLGMTVFLTKKTRYEEVPPTLTQLYQDKQTS